MDCSDASPTAQRVRNTLHFCAPGISADTSSRSPLPGLITWIVPCYTAGKNAEGVGENCLTHGIFAVIPFVNIYCGAVIRGKIREMKGIDVSLNATQTANNQHGWNGHVELLEILQ